MRHSALLILVVWACIGSVPAASSSQTYTSPHTELSYRHEKSPDAGREETRRYWIPAPSGTLSLIIKMRTGEYQVVGEVDGTSSKSILSYSPPVGLGVAEVGLSWPANRMTARFADHAEPGRLEHVAGATPDCEELLEGELPRLRNEVFELVRADYTAWSDPPLHLQALVAALYFSRVVPLMAGGCEESQSQSQGLLAGNCYAATTGYGECAQCCDQESGIESFFCHAATRAVCAGRFCMGLGRLACGGVRHLSAIACMGHNCLGKVGDPACNQDRPCQGSCMYFCGPGWSSGCGSCEGQGLWQTECCR